MLYWLFRIQKAKKHWEHILNIYKSNLFSILVNNWEDTPQTLQILTKYQKKLDNHFYITQ